MGRSFLLRSERREKAVRGSSGQAVDARARSCALEHKKWTAAESPAEVGRSIPPSPTNIKLVSGRRQRVVARSANMPIIRTRDLGRLDCDSHAGRMDPEWSKPLV